MLTREDRSKTPRQSWAEGKWRRWTLAVAVGIAVSLVPPVTSAEALSCAPPPDLTFRQMISQRTTGSQHYDRLVLGKVVTIKDVKPGKGGWKIAKLATAASPVGWAPLVVRVQFWKPEPNPGGPVSGDDYGINYRVHAYYALVAHRAKDGRFLDDSDCGSSSRLLRSRFWNLVRYDRHQ